MDPQIKIIIKVHKTMCSQYGGSETTKTDESQQLTLKVTTTTKIGCVTIRLSA